MSNEIKNEVTSLLERELRRSHPAAEIQDIVKRLNDERFVKKSRLIDGITNYVLHVESVFERTAKALILAGISVDSQMKIIDDQEAHIKAVDAAIDSANEYSEAKNLPKITERIPSERWKDYVALLEKHEQEIKELWATST